MSKSPKPLEGSAFVQALGEVQPPPDLFGVVIVDGDPRWATAVENRVRHHPRFKPLAVTGTAHHAFKLIEQLRPDAIVLATELPDLSGLEALPTIRQLAPDCEIIFLSQATNARELASHFEVFGSLSKFNAAEEFDGALDRLGGFLGLAPEEKAQRRTGTDRRRSQDWSKVSTERRSTERRVENVGYTPRPHAPAEPPVTWGSDPIPEKGFY